MSWLPLPEIPLEEHNQGYGDVDLHSDKITLSKDETIVPVTHLSRLLEDLGRITDRNEYLMKRVACLEAQVEQHGTEKESWKREIAQLKSELDGYKQDL